MRLPFSHPSLQVVSEFAAGGLVADKQRVIATHMQQCARCQNALRFVRQLNAPADAPLLAAGAALLDRIQQSRADGERVILPAPATSVAAPSVTTPTSARVSRFWKVAAGLIVTLGVARVLMPTEASAAGERSTLTLSPKAPGPGGVVTVRYVPVSGSVANLSTLRLRARLRTPQDVAYSVPASHLRTLGALQRERDGSFTGRFTIPDSVVFAVLAVEDTGAAYVDDNVGQGWELPVATADGRPLFAALDQRANDMMGRNWQDAYASMRRATELYPDSISGWTYRQFFENQLFGGATGDSIRRVRDKQINALVVRAKEARALGYSAIGSVYYRAYSRANTRGATSADSAEWDYWWVRLQREYPQHEQVAQRLALWMNVNALGVTKSLDSLDHLYASQAPLPQGAGQNLVRRGAEVAQQLGDDARMRVWMERTWNGAPDSARRMAVWLSTRPPTREEGLAALRATLRSSQFSDMVIRPLGRNATAQQRAVDDLRRATLAAVGRALVAQGRTREALDTLKLAADGGWEPALFRELARSYAQAGDTAAATIMQARLVVDGRTIDAQRDSIDHLGVQRAGAAVWAGLVKDARREMYARLLERSIVRGVPTRASVQSRDGTSHALTSLTKGKPAVVIFWSRNCGYALDAVPKIRELVARLSAAGTPVIFSVDEAPSVELDRVLAEKQITWPVYYDVRTSLADAMRNFGTPTYYVLDRAGRIRFNSVDEVADIHARVAAVTAEGVGGVH